MNRFLVLALASAMLVGCQVKPVETTDRVGDNGRELYSTLSVSSEPNFILSDGQLKSFWRAADTGRVCQSGGSIARGKPIPVRTFSAAVLKELKWRSPYVRVLGQFRPPWVAKAFPEPIVSVSLNQAYGARQGNIDIARSWFLDTSLRALNSDESEMGRDSLREALLTWANANALRSGIHVSWGNRPVDWQVLTLIGALLNGTAIVAEDLSPDEKVVIGLWMNRLMREVGSSYWQSRQDNKAYMTTYYLAIWGAMIGDVDLLGTAMERYKLAINDMRSDGSLPTDSSRSGMGLKYHADSTRYLTAMAQLFNANIGVPLHRYEAQDGRSLETLVGFAIEGMKDPLTVNLLHARPCPDGGDRWGGVKSPSVSYISTMHFLPNYYLTLFPETEHKEWLLVRLTEPQRDEVLGFTAKGLFRVH